MCAILDTNVAGEVFSPSPGPAAAQFFDWMNSAACRLVVGGELRRELERVSAYLRWSRVALRAGRLRQEDDAAIDQRSQQLIAESACRSNDAHVIALAQISGARILYSADAALNVDFQDRKLLQPRGRLLPPGENDNAKRRRRRMLNQPDLCPQRRR